MRRNTLDRRSPRRAHRALGLLALLVMAATTLPADAAVTVRESSANLDIAKRVRTRLQSAGVLVYMTRTTDKTLRPLQRTGLANRLDVDAFISLHNNASSSRSARGSEVYRSIRRDGSATLGKLIVQGLDRRVGNTRSRPLRTRRGCCGDYYYQLRQTQMPAVIVESAFVSNPIEGKKLGSSPAFRQAIANAVADGILAYQRTLTRRKAPNLDPGTVVARGTVPAPSDGKARALGGTRVSLAWTAAPTVTTYRVYRNGRLIAVRSAKPKSAMDTPRLSMTDVWGAPGQRYTYEIRAVTEVAPDAYIESAPLTVTARTPGISVVLDPGHGGRDPGAVRRW